MKINNWQNKTLSIICILAMALLFTACPQENPLLVNPPSQSKTIFLRFVNLAGDKNSRTLAFEEQLKFIDIPYLTGTKADNPATDSAFATISKGGTVEKRSSYKIKFQANTRYTFFGIPSSPRDSIQKFIDSIYFMTTSFSKPTVSDVSFIRFANFIPDSSSSFSYTRGCPSGTTLASSLFYRNLTNTIEVASGKFIFSAQKNINGVIELGTYEVEINSLRSFNYLVFTAREADGTDGIYLLDEDNHEISSLTKLNPTTNKDCFLKVVNTSAKLINLGYNLGKELIPNILPNSISDITTIESCKLDAKDTLKITSNSGLLNQFVASLTVGQNYVLFVSDSSDGGVSIILESEMQNKSASLGKTQLRVINFLNSNNGINVALGARDSSGGVFSTGEIIADEVKSYRSSPVRILKSGDAPISVFSTTAPVKYIFSSVQTIEANANYNIIAKTDDDGTNEFFLLNDAAKNISFAPITEGVLLQFLNVVPGKDYVELNIPSKFNNVKIPYGTAIATIVKQGSNNLTVDGKNIIVQSTNTKRNLIIAGGEANSIDLNDFSIEPMNAPDFLYNRRAINMSKDFGPIGVYDVLPASTNSSWSGALPYQSASAPNPIDNERKLSYFFVSTTDIAKEATRLTEIKLNFGKNYTFIFAGSKGSYSAIILQEY